MEACRKIEGLASLASGYFVQNFGREHLRPILGRFKAALVRAIDTIQ